MSEIMSIHSSLLNDEMRLLKHTNEKYALIYAIIAQFIWAVNGIQLKSYKAWFPEAFSNNSLAFWRSVPIWFLGYFFAKKNNLEITPIRQMKHFKWFLARSAGNYLGIILWVTLLKYFRVSTCQCIAGCHPVLVLFLSVWILKERFYIRYLGGVLLCIIGTAIIVLNEKAPTTLSDNNYDFKKTQSNVVIGLMIGISHLVLFSFTSFGQKVLCNDNITPEVQNYYLGMYNALPALVVCVFEFHFGFSSLLYILYGLSNGIVFYIGNYYTAMALNSMPISKFIPMTYLCTVFIFIMGFVLLHEPVFFTDILGSLIILSFQVYNVWIPLQK